MGSIETSKPDYDVLVIGAGLSGVYACYRMQQLNLKVKVLEAGSSVGGTWYWSLFLFPGSSILLSKTQIATLAADSIANLIATISSGVKKSSTNGHGASTLPHRKKQSDISASFVTNTTYGKICSSIPV